MTDADGSIKDFIDDAKTIDKLARVFPTKTNMSPTDEHAYFGLPPMFPKYDEVHVSVTFTWDIERGYYLKKQWEMVCDNVKIGGPAFDDRGNGFVPGVYLRRGIVITSRGCPNNCPYCFVPKREGKIRELVIRWGTIVQDNNLLACSRSHIDRVLYMLSEQRSVELSGGLEPCRVSDYIVERLRGLKIKQLWLSFDRIGVERSLVKAVSKLSRYFKRDKIRCYVLIGYKNDTLEKAESRLIRAWEIGTLPFAMLYQPKEYPKEWKRFQHNWTRPAAIKAMMKNLSQD